MSRVKQAGRSFLVAAYPRPPARADWVIDISQTHRNLSLVLCALVAALAFAAPAAAQDSLGSSVTQDQYGDNAARFTVGETGDTTGRPTSSVGSLPFTGLDVALMAGAALTLLGAGVVICRRTSADESN